MITIEELKARALAHFNQLFDWFKQGAKSVTVWYGTVLTALPDLLLFVKDNFADLSPYIPDILQKPAMKWIGIGVLIVRMRSIVKAKEPK